MLLISKDDLAFQLQITLAEIVAVAIATHIQSSLKQIKVVPCVGFEPTNSLRKPGLKSTAS